MIIPRRYPFATLRSIAFDKGCQQRDGPTKAGRKGTRHGYVE
jgi:hypothetical protein